MNRTIITRSDIPTQKDAEDKFLYFLTKTKNGNAAPLVDGYITKLQKYIPADVVAIYLTIDSVLRSAGEMNWLLYWLLFLFILIATPFYLWRVAKIKKKLQIVISSLAFIVWVFALGGPFSGLQWYKPLYGAVLLPLYTFLIPIIDP